MISFEQFFFTEASENTIHAIDRLNSTKKALILPNGDILPAINDYEGHIGIASRHPKLGLAVNKVDGVIYSRSLVEKRILRLVYHMQQWAVELVNGQTISRLQKSALEDIGLHTNKPVVVWKPARFGYDEVYLYPPA